MWFKCRTSVSGLFVNEIFSFRLYPVCWLMDLLSVLIVLLSTWYIVNSWSCIERVNKYIQLIGVVADNVDYMTVLISELYSIFLTIYI